MNTHVATTTGSATYNEQPPFHPAEDWPELRFPQRASGPNPAYGLLRRAFVDLGMDRGRFGTPAWNPFGELIRPGDTVVLKPNFVTGRHTAGGTLASVVTHPSVLRAVLDYAFIALDGHGRLVIADAPSMECQWDELMEFEQLPAIQRFYAEQFGFKIDVLDLRNFCIIDPSEVFYADNRRTLPGDPQGTLAVDLGQRSAFIDLAASEARYYGADFNRKETIALHSQGKHEYHLSQTIYSADVVISVPKMKVHKKVGVTLNLKGLVGTCTNKNCLIHYRVGAPGQGGDQIPGDRSGSDLKVLGIKRRLMDLLLARQSPVGDLLYGAARGLYRVFLKPFFGISAGTVIRDGGNWSGNDSAWRMTSDLAKLVFFAQPDGSLAGVPVRRMFCVVDGIMGGDLEGPLTPDPVPAGCLVAGGNPFAVDMVAARLMGFDVRKIRQFDLLGSPEWDFGLRDPGDVQVTVDGKDVAAGEFFASAWRSPLPAFRPHPGWAGAIEC